MEAPLHPRLESLIRSVQHDKKKLAVVQFILFDQNKADKITKAGQKALDKIMKVTNMYNETI